MKSEQGECRNYATSITVHRLPRDGVPIPARYVGLLRTRCRLTPDSYCGPYFQSRQCVIRRWTDCCY